MSPVRTKAGKARRKRVLTRAAWSRQVESATLSQDAERIRDATKVFRQLEGGEQMRLASEIATTRGRELCLAFDSVVSIVAGFKVSGRGKSRRITRTPSVVFVVRDKWRGSKSRTLEQHIPRQMLTYARVGDLRRLCAVPTDVVCETAFASARAHGKAGLEVGDYYGNATCGATLTRAGIPSNVLMSCMHVLTPEIGVNDPAPQQGADVLLLGSEAKLGTSLIIGGRVRSDGELSFDVQFASIQNDAAYRSALVDLRLSPSRSYIRDLDSFDSLGPRAVFWVLSSPNNPNSGGAPPLAARFLRHIPRTVGVIYEFASGSGPQDRLVFHRRLMQFRIDNGAACKEGDSGSAIVLRNSDGTHTLVAMHIGGGLDDEGVPFSYGVPAWQLFDASQYPLPSGMSISPLVGAAQ
jgi:hypothetical protein